jgi:hypothetical protein
MKRKTVTLILVAVVLIVAFLVGVLWVDLSRVEEAPNKLYSYPISVGEKTYVVAVRTNLTDAPMVSLPEFDPGYFNIDFFGPTRETVGFNVTFPAELVGGNISLVWKYYVQDPARYALSSNGTYNSIQMTFNHTATDEHFEIHGTEGALLSGVA